MTKDMAKNPARERFQRSSRIIIKIGSALVCDENRQLNKGWIDSVCADIADLRARDIEVLVVSSGAIAIGRERLGLKGRLSLDESQAAAATGQMRLMQAWQDALAPHDITAAQILLTLEDTESRRRYLNARNTMTTLLQNGALPIINENDTIATSEIRYGDNDRLAAHAAQLITADLLVMLSDVDGLYTEDPRRVEGASHIPLVPSITQEVEQMAEGENKTAGMGSGGMATKIAAAKIAAASGCATIIAKGDIAHPLKALMEGANATLFAPEKNPEKERRKWIAGRLRSTGVLQIDKGALKALHEGASLLPAGLISVSGVFQRGDTVTIEDPNGEKIGQGLSAYGSEEALKICGRKSSELEQLLGYRRRPAIVDRNDLVLKLDAGNKT